MTIHVLLWANDLGMIAIAALAGDQL